MKLTKFFLILVLIFFNNFSHATSQDLNNKIAKNLRCIVCQGQSVFDSDTEFSLSVKILINEKLNDGLTEKEIYEFMKNRYGEWILYDPKFNRNTYFLWLLPILMFLIGGAIIFKLFIIKKN
tara:strand:+ start:190 stop:555 length:366 start_codon:yes stop_codon:yes gene_type:complete